MLTKARSHELFNLQEVTASPVRYEVYRSYLDYLTAR